MTITVFPNYFVLQATSGGPYLSVPQDLPSGFLKFKEKLIWSPHAKFAAEPSGNGDGTLVNIRSCYNNKYWVVHKINNDYWVAASAGKPQEDQTKPACTLFQPQLGDQGVSLISAGMSMYASTSGSTDGLLISDSKLDFNVVDWETLVILPPRVSFKSEVEGNYLCSRVIETKPYLRFESGLDNVGDPHHELFPTADGNYRIKDMHSGKFWRRSPSNWVLEDGEENDNEPGDLFSFIKLSDSVFALRSLGNNTFCGGDGKTDCLNAQYLTISKETRLIVEEPVLERHILDLTYRLSDSRIYYEQSEVVSQAIATNTNPDEESTVNLDFSSAEPRTTYWTNNASSAFGIKLVNLNVTNVPFIVNGQVELVTTEPVHTYEWGVAETKVTTKQQTYTVVVPPLTTMKITLKRNKAACDVPFSYTQRDLLKSGEIVTTIKDDGIFTGSNSYNNSFETSKVVEDDQGRLYL
ncbi:hypothetical protein L1987_81988 [Smallanthus sonchifolius]|uniref:Uncharacterized protein n=1 Tax=Smallanthus sonchifolius TaxID=185202 RepID=A0ACB8YRX7_9ASTR|nr:hypothetical protein L1987_81988 [Smallanthus sonchifolius]